MIKKTNSHSTEFEDKYLVRTGPCKFSIPADYFIDPHSRRNGEAAYLSLMMNLPDLAPCEPGNPHRDNCLTLGLNYNPGGTFEGLVNLLRIKSRSGGVKFPDLKKAENGVLKLNTINSSQGPTQEFYAYILNRRPISLMHFRNEAQKEKSLFRVILIYNEKLDLNLTFTANNLDWYIREEGINHILKLVREWEV